jgi:hypothetical protein
LVETKKMEREELFEMLQAWNELAQE